MRETIVSCARVLLIAGCLIGPSGCGGAGGGPDRYAISGEVKFEGQPVPHGYVMFTPDPTKGNSGPGSGASIVNGTFQTESGKGTVGGPHLVRITGYDGVPITEEGEELVDGTALFPTWETEVDLPNEETVMNFDVPAPE
jgi:hypothetical protein